MHGRYLRLLAAPVVILTTGACFATRNDVRILQQDLQTVRAERMAADSALLRAIEVVSTELTRIGVALAEVGDTARVTHATTMRLRGDVREDLQAIRQQLIMIQELTGQSQRRINELRSEMEARAAELAAQEANQAAVPVVVPVPVPTGAQRPGTARPNTATPPATPPAATPAPARPAPAPGPAQLYQLGQDQQRRGSVSSARAAYTELLDKHSTSDLAPKALYGIAETWADEGNGVAADSVYALVVTRFPRSDMAPNALYKRASAFRSVGRTEQAQALYRQIVDQYPQSDAALLAQEFLRPKTP
jgi:TolA-binding protein